MSNVFSVWANAIDSWIALVPERVIGARTTNERVDVVVSS